MNTTPPNPSLSPSDQLEQRLVELSAGIARGQALYREWVSFFPELNCQVFDDQKMRLRFTSLMMDSAWWGRSMSPTMRTIVSHLVLFPFTTGLETCEDLLRLHAAQSRVDHLHGAFNIINVALVNNSMNSIAQDDWI